MKKAAFLLTMLIAFTAMAQDNKSFHINGNLLYISLPVEKVYLSYPVNGNYINDSAYVKEGRFSFTGKLQEPVLANLKAVYHPDKESKQPVRTSRVRDRVLLFLSTDTITITSTDSFSNAIVTGSQANDEFVKLSAMLKPVTDKMTAAGDEYSKARAAKDEPARKAAEEKIDALDKENREIHGVYAKNNLQSPIALYAVTQYAGWVIDADSAEPLFKQLPAAQKAYYSAKTLADQIEIAKKTGIGKTALPFTQNDTLGKPVSLVSFRGKYLLVDFWASWCGPCRRENPNVVKAYQAFKDRGFQILGVSLDRPDAKDRWIQAIHEDNLTWTHISDLKYWQNEVARLYGIQAIPQNLLLDPQGKIIAKNLNGEALQKKLLEIFKP